MEWSSNSPAPVTLTEATRCNRERKGAFPKEGISELNKAYYALIVRGCLLDEILLLKDVHVPNYL